MTTLRGCPPRSDSLDVRDVLDRVGRTRVLGQRLIRQVEPPIPIGDDILQHRAEAMAGGPDFRLRLRRQVDDLGIAAAFEVEDAALTPAMLIVADQLSMRVRRERRLSRARQTEEQRDVALAADIGAAMHRQHALGRQQPVHHGEDRLLDLPRVLGPGDDDGPLFERQRDRGAAAHAVDCRIGLEMRGMQDDVIGWKSASSSGCGRMKMLRANKACHAPVVTRRTRTRCAGSAPAYRS